MVLLPFPLYFAAFHLSFLYLSMEVANFDFDYYFCIWYSWSWIASCKFTFICINFDCCRVFQKFSASLRTFLFSCLYRTLLFWNWKFLLLTCFDFFSGLVQLVFHYCFRNLSNSINLEVCASRIYIFLLLLCFVDSSLLFFIRNSCFDFWKSSFIVLDVFHF